MYQREVVISNRAGIHARPASKIVTLASQFKSDIYVYRDGDKVNAKSIMGLISMGLHYNTKIVVVAEGEDEKEAVDSLVELIERRFED